MTRRHAPLTVLALAVALSVASASGTLAAPVDPNQRIPLTQPDGSSFVAVPFGDEWYHGFETADGRTIVRDPQTRAWEYAEKTSDGRLVAGGVRAGDPAPGAAPPHLRDQTRLRRAERISGSLGAPGAGSPNPANRGTQRSIVILVQFANQSSLGTTAAQWNSRFFGAANSVRDYYDDVSYGNLAIAPGTESFGTANDGVVGWLTLTSNHPQADDLNNPADVAAAQATVRDAIVASNPYVNYASYDTNGDGAISAHELHITVIPAGWEAATGCGATPAVWGHKYTTAGVTPTVDGVQAGGDYTTFGEEHCDAGATPAPRQATLGIIVHEMGHDLDLPDLYDVDGSSSGGVGNWSVMSYGTWLNLAGNPIGSLPSQLDAFSKSYEGWLTPTRVIGTSNGVSLAQAETNPRAIQLLANPNGVDWTFDVTAGTGEYFLAENRQRTGYDGALPGCGTLIWHIDETRSGENSQANSNDSRRLVQLEEADGNNNPFDAGDAYVGDRYFTNTSTPNSRLYSGAASRVGVNHFSACAATARADFSSGAPNDDFASALVLSGSQITRTTDSNLGATEQAGEPDHAFNQGGASIWYRWTAPASGPVTIDTAGTGFDTTLGVYTGTAVGSLTTVTSNDDEESGSIFTSKVSFDATAGTTYRIAVDGFRTGVEPALAGVVKLHLSQGGSTRGDFNGDGIGDLAVGVPGEDVGSASDAGAIHVLYGTAFGLPGDNGVFLTQSSTGSGTSEGGDGFGASLTAGDFDDDGVSDLAVGAPGEDVGSASDAGTVNVLYGGGFGIAAAGSGQFVQGNAGGVTEAGDRFGASLASGDFSNGGGDDLAIGAPGEDSGGSDVGAVNAMYGSATGIDGSGNVQFLQGDVAGSTEGGDRFGFALAAGRFDADAFDDLGVGAPDEDSGALANVGAVNVIRGGGFGLAPAGAKQLVQGDAGGTTEAGDRFGAALAAGDFNNGSGDDLAVGSPDEDVGSIDAAGAIEVLYGAAAGIDAAGNVEFTQGNAAGTNEPGDRFGFALAAGNFNNDAFDDLGIGAPDEDSGTLSSAGAVNVMNGGGFGLAPAGAKQFVQANAAGTTEANDRFGAALAAGDYNETGGSDLAVGAPYEAVGSTSFAGTLNVMYGSSGGGIDAAGNSQFTQGSTNKDTVEVGDFFASALR